MTEIASSGQLRAGLARWLLVCVPGINLLGFLSAKMAISGEDNPWFAALAKPEIYPAPIVFPIVWTTLYCLMGVALAIIISARNAPGRGAALGLFGLHMLANLVWSPLFFGAHQITGALVDAGLMAASLAGVIVLFHRVRPVAAYLLLPYLGWVLFACALTYQVLALNPQADGQDAPAPATHIKL